MNRQEKQVIVSDLKKLFTDFHSTFVINYQGLTVEVLQALRKDLRKEGEVFKVTKARLMKRAAKDAGQSDEWVEGLEASLKGQIGLVFSSSDISLISKKLVNFAKAHEKMKIVSARVESKIVSVEEINLLASLPSRDQLLAMVFGTMKAPIAALARVLEAIRAKREEGAGVTE